MAVAKSRITKPRRSVAERNRQRQQDVAAKLAAAKPAKAAKPAAKADAQPVATRITWPMAMVIKRWAGKQGYTFVVDDKLGTNSYAISVNGLSLSVSEASQLIGLIKSEQA